MTRSVRGRCSTRSAEVVTEATQLLPLVYFLFRKKEKVWAQLEDERSNQRLRGSHRGFSAGLELNLQRANCLNMWQPNV